MTSAYPVDLDPTAELLQNAIIANGVLRVEEPENSDGQFSEKNIKGDPKLVQCKMYTINNTLSDERANAGMLPSGYYDIGDVVYSRVLKAADYGKSTSKNAAEIVFKLFGW